MSEINIFDPRTMMKAVRQMKPPQRYFLNTYFKGTKTFTTKSVDVDIKKSKRRMAKFDNPRAEGTVVDKEGFYTVQFEPPYIKPKMVTTAEDLLKRAPGDGLYDTTNPLANASRQLGEDLSELDDMIARREEWMALRALQDGEITVTGNGINRKIEFDFDPSHLVALTGTDAWDDEASDPIKDLQDWREKVLQDFGYAPTECIMGKDAAQAFINHPKVQVMFDKRHIVLGTIKVDVAENFVNYGYIDAIGMSIKVVSERFIDPEDDIEGEMVDANAVILLTPAMQATKLYGAIKHMKALRAVPRFAHSWETEDPSDRWLQMHSSPLPAITTPDAVLTARVLED